MPLTEREKFDRFIDKYSPGIMADAFFWCSGLSWANRRYCAVILAKKGSRSAALEIRQDTPYALAKAMREAGYQARADVVRKLCESAPRSPTRRMTSRAPYVVGLDVQT